MRGLEYPSPLDLWDRFVLSVMRVLMREKPEATPGMGRTEACLWQGDPRLFKRSLPGFPEEDTGFSFCSLL